MKKQSTACSAFFTPRVLVTLVVCAAACSLVAGTLLAFFRSETPTNVSRRSLTFAERVAYQRAIEDVYWRHRIWPKERPDLKPSLDAVMSQAQMDRMAKHTRQPEVLRELFEALGNDPFLIAECLARPLLTERLFQSTG